jgi:hypothetical protein
VRRGTFKVDKAGAKNKSDENLSKKPSDAKKSKQDEEVVSNLTDKKVRDLSINIKLVLFLF